MKRMLTCVFLLCFLLSSHSLAAGSAPEKPKEVSTKEASADLKNIIDKIQVNQSKINDMYAETITTITSSVVLKEGAPKTMVQKGKMWTKGKDKSKIEMISPMKQITIINGDKMAVVNPETGKRVVKDLKKEGMQQSRDMSLEKAMEYFDFAVIQRDSDTVIQGVPKIKNKFVGKMEFYIDRSRWVPVKILMYNPAGKLLSKSKIEYSEFKTGEGKKAWVPVKNNSTINTPAGEMGMVTEFENVKINQGVKDDEFKI